MCRKFSIACVEIHSLMKQRLRMASLASFKSSQCRVLFATDVASRFVLNLIIKIFCLKVFLIFYYSFSRGLDIPTVDLVINENVPFVPKEYIHRVGRTARAGKLNFKRLISHLINIIFTTGRGGMAITLVTQYDVPLMHKIENKISKLNLRSFF